MAVSPVSDLVQGQVDLSIVIVNWNTSALLACCLHSIEEFPPSGSLEVWVVDNASTDGSTSMVRERFPWALLIENPDNVGFARANNLAMRRARGRYILLLNSDTILPAGGLARLVEFADAHPSAGIVGCRLLNADGTFQAAMNDFPTLFSALLEAWGLAQRWYNNPYFPSYPPGKSTQACQTDWLGGACLLARHAAVDQVGLLDEQFFMNGEEVDWCHRMKDHGWQVWYTPDVEVTHLGGGSADRASARQRMRLYAGKVRMMHKHRGRAAGVAVRLNYRTSSLVKAACYGARFLFNHDPVTAGRARMNWQVAVARSWT